MDKYIWKDMNVSKLLKNQKTKAEWKDVVWQNRAIFKGFATIKGVVHRMKLKEGAVSVFCPQRRRPPKEEEKN